MDCITKGQAGYLSWLEHPSDLDHRSWGCDQHGLSEHNFQLSRARRARNCR